MEASSTSTWAFYYLQAEDGEDRSHPNAFRIPKPSSSDITLQDIHTSFPLSNPNAFHFRFRMNSAKGDTFYWKDITSLSQTIPLVNGRVIAKVLRLQRPSKNGLILHHKPILKWIDNLPSKTPSVVQPISSSRPASSDRPQKYSDSERPPKYSNTSAPAVRPAASVTSPKQQNPEPAQQSTQNTESFEDFLSGGGPSKPKQEVDFMSSGSTWQNPNDFIQTMEQPKAPPRVKTPPKAVARGPAKDFNDDCGQIIGPVTLAEMEEHKVSSDGTQVYNPDMIDKSTKSATVRAAMEERDRVKAAEIERARQDLLRRNQEKASMDDAKAQSVVVLGPKMKMWAEDNGRKKNIRTLLSTMHQVMWPDSKWAEVNMAKLLTPNDVKKVYRRAIMVVHPDKGGGRTPDQLVVAERIFDALNTAWEEFARTEMK